jgi:hypothetical protein
MSAFHIRERPLATVTANTGALITATVTGKRYHTNSFGEELTSGFIRIHIRIILLPKDATLLAV